MSNPAPIRVLSSLVAPDALSALVNEFYDFGTPAQCKLACSNDNHTYLLTAGGVRYVLRVYRHHKHWLQRESDYLFELDWLDFLRQRNMPVSYPIRRRDGSFLGSLNAPEGLRQWAVFSFADGSISLDPARASIFGRSVAEIHIASNEFKSPHERVHFDLEHLLDLPLSRIGSFIGDTRREDLEFLSHLAEQLRERVQETPFPGDEYGIIGGDFHGSNHHFTEDNRLTHFDFDLCSYSWRAYDIAIFRWAAGRSDELWAPFLQGYQSVRKLSEAELDLIPTFVQCRRIWIMGSHTTYPEANLWIDDAYWDRYLAALRETADTGRPGSAT
jgi:Ser/Thr protein kinase RdoA (MazF antagonist)